MLAADKTPKLERNDVLGSIGYAGRGHVVEVQSLQGDTPLHIDAAKPYCVYF